MMTMSKGLSIPDRSSVGITVRPIGVGPHAIVATMVERSSVAETKALHSPWGGLGEVERDQGIGAPFVTFGLQVVLGHLGLFSITLEAIAVRVRVVVASSMVEAWHVAVMVVRWVSPTPEKRVGSTDGEKGEQGQDDLHGSSVES